MEVSVQSLSPSGINVINGFAEEADYLDVIEIDRVNIADGVVDRNKILSLSDICITHLNIDAQQPIDFAIQTDKPAIVMNFSISSESVYKFEDISAPISLNGNQQNIVYYPETAYKNCWSAGANQEKISIMLPPAYVEKYIPREMLFSTFIKNMEKDRTALLCDAALPITPRMYVLLREILDNKHRSGFKRMHIESKIIELLMLQLEQFEVFHNGNMRTEVDKRTYKKMQDAKNIIEDSLSSPCSLIDLANRVGTNEYHLKKAFKKVYGTTVYGYLTEMRMHEAKRLLLTGDLNVSEVALMMGYNDSTNFTAAFKKYYGFTPGKVKP
ncbi:AraC family transcriptional regulator [Sphingobacterium haloxyli]|uniref:HTH araC/xylS-type domain-containing protein n=1 Tax=Sphingobacterium haloxyli TaxID=2100533 RepID=A0A2S9J4S1_9SPHI|nr:AraC family transcriptional regulator [Sphingobacterium haloxyli]PRD47796.1 hypothetical protein C5745_07730 [Sphingobacterium haloxyli]